MKSALFFFLLLGFVLTSSVSHGSQCSGPNVHTISVPYFYGEAGTAFFDYAFEFVPSAYPNMPTVIVLNGGPGGITIGHPFGSVPSVFNVIYTDQRGTGCNQIQSMSLPTRFFRTVYLAQDILALIDRLKLTNYILFGASYGTQHATVVASMAEKLRMVRPSAVVLQGISGHAFRNYEEAFQAYTNEWERVKTLLSPKVVSLFDSSTLPLGFSSEQWGMYISINLLNGDLPGQGHYFQQLFKYLEAGDPKSHEQLRDYLNKSFMSQYSPRIPPEPIFKIIGCREIWGSVKMVRRLVNGRLTAAGPNICAGLGFDEPYDSKQWPISSPIYYFQGPFDPATPMSQARYHFQHQSRAKRYFITVGQAGHGPLTRSLAYLGCAEKIWSAIGLDPSQLSVALSSCKNWPITIEAANPET
jgi:pimeloyl-ACP methyl ester carboxylesterase